jgi:hypothetical protein
MPSSRFVLVCLLSLVGNVSSLPQLAAQRVYGRTVERPSMESVSFVQLRLFGTIDTITAISDSLGFYSLALKKPGRYVLRAERIGYETLTSASFQIEANERFELNAILTPRGLVLDPIVVTGNSGLEPGRFGFERRCAVAESWCLDSDSLLLRKARDAAQMFRGIDGILLKRSAEGDFSVIKSFDCLQVFLNHVVDPILVSGNLIRSREPTVSWHWRAINPEDVLGIEVYRDRRSVPKELVKGMRFPYTFSCGVAIIWTRTAW